MQAIARLTPVPVREIWPHEAQDFTVWLAENLEYLEDATGLRLTLVEREAATGIFYADILAEDENGDLVVIENQLESTDHEHLGKLLTYMANHNAKTAIWIAVQPRPEHKRAVQWLNEILSDVSFYLLQVEAYRIEGSRPAVKFTVMAGPNEASKEVGTQRKELAERHRLCMTFWEGFLQKANETTSLHSNISPRPKSNIEFGAGKSGITFKYSILADKARVELYIHTKNQETNKRYFDALYAHKREIEKVFGAPLDWQRLEGQKFSRIAHHITDKGGLKDKESWSELQDAMIDAMVRLHRAISPYIKNL